MTNRIQLVDLQKLHTPIQEEMMNAVARVMCSGRFTSASETESLELAYAAYTGTRFAVAVNSGTSALHLALLAAGVGAGDEVITTAFTFLATAAAIEFVQARPVFVDIDPSTLTINPAELAKVLTPRTKAIIPVHIYGQPVDMDPIMAMAREKNIVVIEDASQAHGAQYRGLKVGSIGDMGCFSFFPAKNLGACGEAGIITTNNPTHAETLKMLRNWGSREKNNHLMRGFNYRIDEIQAALLVVKLKYLDSWNSARRKIADAYTDVCTLNEICIQGHVTETESVFHIYAIRIPDRVSWRRQLAEKKIDSEMHYPLPLHLLPVFEHLNYQEGDLPATEKASGEVLSLPIHPFLSVDEVTHVANTIASFARK